MDEVCSLRGHGGALIVAIRVIVILHQSPEAIVGHLQEIGNARNLFAASGFICSSILGRTPGAGDPPDLYLLGGVPRGEVHHDGPLQSPGDVHGPGVPHPHQLPRVLVPVSLRQPGLDSGAQCFDE